MSFIAIERIKRSPPRPDEGSLFYFSVFFFHFIEVNGDRVIPGREYEVRQSFLAYDSNNNTQIQLHRQDRIRIGSIVAHWMHMHRGVQAALLDVANDAVLLGVHRCSIL